MLDRLSATTDRAAYLLLTLTMLFWAGNFTLGRWASPLVPPFTLTAARWTIAAALMLCLARRHLVRDWPVIRANAPILVLLAVVGSGSFNALQYMALAHTTATSAGIINSTSPVMIAVASYLLVGERMSASRIAGIAVSLAGVLMVMTRGDWTALAALALNRGDLILLGAMALWAIYTALLARRPPIHGFSFAAVSFAIAAAINVPIALVEQALGARAEIGAATLAVVAYVAVFPSVAAYLCFNRGVEIIGPARAGAFMHLVPLFTAVLAMTFLGERPGWHHGIGLALILAGVWLAASRLNASG